MVSILKITKNTPSIASVKLKIPQGCNKIEMPFSNFFTSQSTYSSAYLCGDPLKTCCIVLFPFKLQRLKMNVSWRFVRLSISSAFMLTEFNFSQQSIDFVELTCSQKPASRRTFWYAWTESASQGERKLNRTFPLAICSANSFPFPLKVRAFYSFLFISCCLLSLLTIRIVDSHVLSRAGSGRKIDEGLLVASST